MNTQLFPIKIWFHSNQKLNEVLLIHHHEFNRKNRFQEKEEILSLLILAHSFWKQKHISAGFGENNATLPLQKLFLMAAWHNHPANCSPTFSRYLHKLVRGTVADKDKLIRFRTSYQTTKRYRRAWMWKSFGMASN